jgi:hypothetical protein
MHKFDPRKREALDDPKRFLFENRDKILSETGVKRGDIVADIGCGTVFLRMPFARYVKESGKVYTLDTSPTMTKVHVLLRVEGLLANSVLRTYLSRLFRIYFGQRKVRKLRSEQEITLA